jgi:hypothetical protein
VVLRSKNKETLDPKRIAKLLQLIIIQDIKENMSEYNLSEQLRRKKNKRKRP